MRVDPNQSLNHCKGIHCNIIVGQEAKRCNPTRSGTHRKRSQIHGSQSVPGALVFWAREPLSAKAQSPQKGRFFMRSQILKAMVLGTILAPWVLAAQAPTGAPAGTTGKCKDGTYTSAPKKQGACRGHQGVDTWYASAAPAGNAATPAQAPASAPKAASQPAPAAPAATPAPAAAPKSSSKASGSAKTPAPGGGPGLVWVNTSSNVYHCYGGADYGTTKAGKYMSEADAKAAGARPARGQACSK